jgi:hypothetical protein
MSRSVSFPANFNPRSTTMTTLNLSTVTDEYLKCALRSISDKKGGLNEAYVGCSFWLTRNGLVWDR